MEQRIYLDEYCKLVVETNNGKINFDGTTAEIEGDFTIDAENVSKLLALLNKNAIGRVAEFHYFIEHGIRKGDKFCIMQDGELAKIMREQDKENEKLHSECEELKQIRNEHTNLLLKIDNFNASRRPWERKFNIE
jgi:hypothetical protein